MLAKDRGELGKGRSASGVLEPRHRGRLVPPLTAGLSQAGFDGGF